MLRRIRPWEKSTGPKTIEGKAVSSQNASNPFSRRKQAVVHREAREDFALSQFYIEETSTKPYSNLPVQKQQRSGKADELYFGRVLRAFSRWKLKEDD